MNNESTFRIEKFLVFAKSILRVRYTFMFVRSALHEFRTSIVRQVFFVHEFHDLAVEKRF